MTTEFAKPGQPAPARVELCESESGVQRLLERERAGELDPAEAFTFAFKSRPTHGRAIHVASLYEGGAGLVEQLVQLRACVDEPCTTTAWQREQLLQPVHLASGAGNLEVLRRLLELRADVDAPSTCGGEAFYRPLHEAAYHCQHEAVRCLLQRRASPRLRNLHGQQPLHTAAASGCWRSAQALVAARADVACSDENNQTPLMTAILSIFPDRKLHILARPCICDLKSVAQEAPSAALELLEDHQSWRRGLTDPSLGYELPCTEDLVQLMGSAPRVAARLLEVLTDEPRAVDSFHHPLPRHAPRHSFDYRQCLYTTDQEWTHYPDRASEQGVGDLFRHELEQREGAGSKKFILLQGGQQQRRLGRVDVSLLRLPNVVSLKVLFALAQMQSLDKIEVFRRPAVQAILDFAWVHIARRQFTVNIAIRVLEILVLGWITFAPPHSGLGCRLAWSFLAAASTRSAFQELAQLAGYRRYLDTVWPYFDNAWNYVDIASIAIFMALVWRAFMTLDFADRVLLAIVSFARWVQLLYNLGAYRFGSIGYSIVPIFRSFFQVKGILMVTFMTFLAFAHAFAALENPGESSPQEVLINAFRVLLVGDGDGIDFVLSLGDRPDGGSFVTQFSLCFAVIIFCVCVLNLFIAVHGEAYSLESSQADQQFYRYRASNCLGGMLQPRWRRHLRAHPSVCYAAIMAVALPSWLGLLHVSVHPVLGSALLLFAQLLGDMILRKRPWRELYGHPIMHADPNDRRTHPEAPPTPDTPEDKAALPPRTPQLHMQMYLWWCDWADGEWSPEESGGDDLSSLGETLHTVSSRLQRLCSSVEGLDRRLGGLDERLAIVEGSVTKLREGSSASGEAELVT